MKITFFPWPHISLPQLRHLLLATLTSWKRIVDTSWWHFSPPGLLPNHSPNFPLPSWRLLIILFYNVIFLYQILIYCGSRSLISSLWDIHAKSFKWRYVQMTCKYISLVSDLPAGTPDPHWNCLLDIPRTCHKYIKINVSAMEFLIVFPEPT